MKRTVSIILCVLLAAMCLPSGGCGDKKMIMAIRAMPVSLDPQLDSGGAGDSVYAFLFSGLLRYGADGGIETDCAESYEYSPDGLKLTFILKKGLTWSTGEALTSADFAFALKRVLAPETGSRYAPMLMSISGAGDFVNGRSPDISGVTCPDDVTLVLGLDYRDDDLLSCFASTCLSPCREAFFDTTGGAYGKTTSKTLANGRYTVRSRTDTAIVLIRKRGVARSLPSEITFVLSSSYDAAALTENLDSGRVSYAVSGTALDVGGGVKTTSVGNATWTLFMRSSGEGMVADPRFPLLLAYGAVGQLQEQNGVSRLIPEGCAYFSGGHSPLGSDNAAAKRIISELCSEAGVTSMPKVTLAVPDTAEARAVSDELVGLWQKNLGFFVTREYYDEAKAEKLISSGGCDMAVIPLAYDGSAPAVFYAAAAKLLALQDVTDGLAALASCEAGEYCASAEELIRSTGRALPFAGSYDYIYTSGKVYYEPHFGTAEMAG